MGDCWSFRSEVTSYFMFSAAWLILLLMLFRDGRGREDFRHEFKDHPKILLSPLKSHGHLRGCRESATRRERYCLDRAGWKRFPCGMWKARAVSAFCSA